MLPITASDDGGDLFNLNGNPYYEFTQEILDSLPAGTYEYALTMYKGAFYKNTNPLKVAKLKKAKFGEAKTFIVQ